MNTITYRNKLALVTCAVLGTAAFSVGAQADEASAQATTRTVHYADLNLNTDGGAKVLYQRIHSAAEQVCGDANAKQLEEASAARACIDRAVVSSVRAVNRLQLTKTAMARGYDLKTQLNVASLR